jgi:hypothetical protein
MTEAPKGLLSVLGEAFAEMQQSGCDYQTALERSQQKLREDVEEFTDTNVVSLEEFRKKRFH